MDFTLITYKLLLNTLIKQGFSFLPFYGFISSQKVKVIFLRHDVDLLPGNSLKFARIQSENGIKGTYYFRIVSESWDEAIINKISEMGHEVGYHYEDLSFARAKFKAEGRGRRAEGEELEKQIVDVGIESFKRNLEKLRKISPVKTICMHGSPTSKWDSRLLWKYWDYHYFGIIGEPYFDINFDEVLYLTDTGRRWDGDFVNIRDNAVIRNDGEMGRKGEGETRNKYSDWKVKPFNYRQYRVKDNPATSNHSVLRSLAKEEQPAPLPKFHSTFDIIKAAQEGKLPDKIMMTFHPQRWTDKPIPWVKELVWQNAKNIGKYILIKSGIR